MNRIQNPFSVGLNRPSSFPTQREKSNFDFIVDRLDNSRANIEKNTKDYINGLGVTYSMLHA